ncbi:MAG: efflux RND transporter permease subunit [Verrucomicrobia bacterium]|nr:efflux RND transporter permease subunit [Verrucomicrobiota bacterium]
MMKRVIAGLLAYRALVLGLLVAYTISGWFAFQRLPVEAYPDVTNIQAQIITLWPGHAAEEVEKFVTIPVENQLNSLPQRAALRSISLFGLSVVTVVCEDDADNYQSRNLVSQALAGVTLPTGAQASVSPDSTAVGEIYRYTLQGPPELPATELRALEDWVVERQFRTVPGVVDVVGFGGPTKQYQALVDPVKLKGYGLTLKNVVDALSASNTNAGGAYIERGAQMFIVRGIGLIKNLDDIRATVLAVRGGTPITVGDVARVQVGNQLRLGRVGLNKPKSGQSATQTDQDDVVQGIVLLRKGENALEVLKRVEGKAADINKTYLPPGVKLVTHYDRTELIQRTLHTVRHNTIEGIALVLAVLVAFLGFRNVRSALIVASVIPLALLGAFMLLDLRNIPANLISLGAIDFGIIVDAAVVVIENVIHLIEERRASTREAVRAAIVDGVSTMGKPIFFSKLVLLTAFLPLYTMQRVEGRIFRPMALTLTFAILVGTALAFLVVPAFASFFLRGTKSSGEDGSEANAKVVAVPALKMGFGLVGWISRRYTPILAFALRRRALVIGVSLAALVLTGLLAKRLGSEFLPKLEEGALWVHVNYPQSISPTEAARLTRQVRETLASFPEATTVVTQLGRPDDGTDVGGFDANEIFVDLRPVSEWKTARDRDGLVAAMNDKLKSQLPGVDFLFSQVIEDNVNEAVSGIKGELGIKIFGTDPEKLQALADQISRIVKEVPGAVDVAPEQLAGQPQVQARVDRASVARYGLSVGDVNSLVETAFGGTAATQIIEGERTFDLSVKLAPEAIADLERIRAIPLFGSNNEIVSLGQVADVAPRNGFARIYREDNERRIAVKFSTRGRDLGSVVVDAQTRVNQGVKLPIGYRTEWTGSFENQQRALARLMVVVPITLAAIFFVLFTAFGSAKLATIILLNVPLAAVGGVVGLWLAGLPLSVSALVGFVALFGASVQNGVILLERIRELAAEGRDSFAAAREGALARLRAVLMTSAMAAFGLLPAALSHEVGAETARPFATVIVGGLVSSTVLTLLVLPVVCTFFLGRRPDTFAPAAPVLSTAPRAEHPGPVLTPSA